MRAASPTLMCIAFEQVEVTLLEVVCPNCRSVLDAGGDLGDVGAPRTSKNERVQIGPLDVSSSLPDQVAATTCGCLIFPRPVLAGRGVSIQAL